MKGLSRQDTYRLVGSVRSSRAVDSKYGLDPTGMRTKWEDALDIPVGRA